MGAALPLSGRESVMNKPPHIASMGLPPERHADRIVGEMLRYLAIEHAGTFDKVYGLLSLRRAGNPKAQRRLVAQVKRIGGPTVIDVMLNPATRGRHRMMIFHWYPYDETRRKVIEPGDLLPLKPWLACGATVVEGRPQDGASGLSSHCGLYVTHHALSRLAQRVGARTINDMIAAAKAIWKSYVDEILAKDTLDMPDGLRLLFKLPDGSNAKAVVNKYDLGGVVVVTIVPDD